MVKLLLVCALCIVTLSACRKQKQASAEVGTVPKQILDKATNDLNNSQTLETEQRKVLENADASANAGK